MSIKTALNFSALDSTWTMIGNIRNPWSKGIIENTDGSRKGLFFQEPLDEGTGVISLNPYQLISRQGVVIWDESNSKISVGQDGTFYIVFYSLRGETSSIVTQFEVKTSLPGDDDYICFGEVNMVAGTLDTVNYTSRQSVAKIGHLCFKGKVDTLPNLDPGGDIEDSKAGSDVKTGDVFITVIGEKAYFHIADIDAGTYRVLTAGATERDKIILGTGVNQIIIDGTTGEITVVGVPGGQIKFDKTGTGIIPNVSAKVVLADTKLMSDNVEGKSPAQEIILGRINGSPLSATVVPVINNGGGIGKSGLYWGTGFINNLSSHSIMPKSNTTSAIGSLSTSFPIAYLLEAYIQKLKAKNGLTKIELYHHLVPDTNNTKDLGEAVKQFNNLYVKNIINNGNILFKSGSFVAVIPVPYASAPVTKTINWIRISNLVVLSFGDGFYCSNPVNNEFQFKDNTGTFPAEIIPATQQFVGGVFYARQGSSSFTLGVLVVPNVATGSFIGMTELNKVVITDNAGAYSSGSITVKINGKIYTQIYAGSKNATLTALAALLAADYHANSCTYDAGTHKITFIPNSDNPVIEVDITGVVGGMTVLITNSNNPAMQDGFCVGGTLKGIHGASVSYYVD